VTSHRLVRDNAERLLALLRRPRPRRLQIIIGAFAVVILALGTTIAIGNLPSGAELEWWPIAVLLVVGTPWHLLILSAEVSLTGRLADVRLPRRTCLRVAVIGTSFNLLPIPGAALTRLDALLARGGGVGRATGAIVAVGMIWLAVALWIAGLALIGTSWVSVLLLVGGGLAAMATVTVIRRYLPHVHRTDLGRVVLLEASFVLTHAIRLALALVALGVTAPIRAPLVMAASSAISSALGIAPGGLGIREAIATVLGDLAGITASTALLAAVVDRAAALAGTLISSVCVLPLLHRYPAHPKTPPRNLRVDAE
jgi:hypothetical protein